MKRPSTGLAVIIQKGNSVLMLKRQGSHGADTWSFPGGHIEGGESLVSCAYREVKEETGLTRDNINLREDYAVAATNDIFKDEEKHYTTLFMSAVYISGEPKIMEPNKCSSLKWVNWYRISTTPKSLLFLPIQNLLKQKDIVRKFT